jgi:hypothetical protein
MHEELMRAIGRLVLAPLGSLAMDVLAAVHRRELRASETRRGSTVSQMAGNGAGSARSRSALHRLQLLLGDVKRRRLGQTRVERFADQLLQRAEIGAPCSCWRLRWRARPSAFGGSRGATLAGIRERKLSLQSFDALGRRCRAVRTLSTRAPRCNTNLFVRHRVALGPGRLPGERDWRVP